MKVKAGLAVLFAVFNYSVTASAEVRCIGECEYYASYKNQTCSAFVETVDVNFEHEGRIVTELTKYRHPVLSSAANDFKAKFMLVSECMDIAVINRSELFVGTVYAPRVSSVLYCK